jgi:N-acetylmuramoyl-L-alanine amidase
MRNRLTAAFLLALAGVGCSTNRTTSGPQTSSVTPSPIGSVTPSAAPSPASSPASSPATNTLLTPSPSPVGSAPGLVKVGAAGAQLFPSPGGKPAHRLAGGVTVPFESRRSGWAEVLTPCQNRMWLKTDDAHGLPNPKIVLDAGHGGDELGAQGPTGLREKNVNLDVANRVALRLQSEGISSAVSRSTDYRATLDFRSEFATSVRPKALVSIHHNSVPDGPRDRPGTETYYQFGSADSKRLAGLIYEEAIKTIGAFTASWVGDTDAGAKWRLSGSGRDYYAILRRPRAGGVTAVMAELSFISNASEEGLLRQNDFLDAEANGVARGILRFLRTKDPGSGFTTPYPRTEPAGPGGGRAGCVDPS